MSTHSVTVVYDEDERVLIRMYRQMDGYFSGHGKDLVDFLNGMWVVNGIGRDTPKKAANGMQCLAAQIVAEFKDGIGGIYMLPLSYNWSDIQYTYEVKLSDDKHNVLIIGKGVFSGEEVHWMNGVPTVIHGNPVLD